MDVVVTRAVRVLCYSESQGQVWSRGQTIGDSAARIAAQSRGSGDLPSRKIEMYLLILRGYLK